ncbi:DUF559 domain-containing protein [Corynebacterium sp.]|jgi:hypothetical protein|uniref:DUF559 domain-containing protein n=1 Tax=Corynebacterium sp. TaxID=1720 RepID=UPI0025BD6962|nr:DUF559 domain-containing protein [Corynebacterium sp.]
MPTVVPVSRTTVAARDDVTDWSLRHSYTAVARGVVIPTPEDWDPSQFDGFGLDIVTRTWGNHLVHPEAVVGGWAAVAVYGLKWDRADCAPVVLLAERRPKGTLASAKAALHPLRPVFLRLPPGTETRTPCLRFPSMKVVAPQVAAVQCLWTVITGRHSWWVHDVPGLTRVDVMAVQFLDAFAQCTWITREEIRTTVKGVIPQKVVTRLLDLSDGGAQSPMETVMRLIVRDALPAPYRWKSQIRVDFPPDAGAGWTPRTLPDLGCEELKIALYYDGGHHTEGAQTEVDFDQFHALRDLGWEVLRFNRSHLRDPQAMLKLVENAVDRAMRRRNDSGAAA